MRFLSANVNVPVTAVSLTVAVRSAPWIGLVIEEGAARPNELNELIRLGAPVTLDWESNGLESSLIPLGLETNGRESWLICGYCMPGLVHWFDQPVTGLEGCQWLVYSRAADASLPVSDYLNLLTGGRMEIPLPEVLDQLELLLPPGSAIVRPAGWNHRDFLDAWSALLQGRLGSPVTWFCTAQTAAQPLRLAGLPSAPVELKNDWRCTGRAPWPGTSSSKLRLLRYLTLDSQNEVPSLFQGLATMGTQGARGQLGGIAQDEDALMAPGPVQWGARRGFCTRASYRYDNGINSVQSTIEIVDELPPVGCLPQSRLPVAFDQWLGDHPGVVQVLPDNAGSWAAVGPNGPDPHLPIPARMLAPSQPAQAYAGLYIRHQKGDPYVLQVDPGETPLVLGAIQHQIPELEKAHITLSGETIALSISSIETPLTDADRLHLTPQQAVLRNGQRVATNIGQQTLLTLTADDLQIATKTHLQKDAKVDGNLDVA